MAEDGGGAEQRSLKNSPGAAAGWHALLERKETELGWPKQTALRLPDDHVERSTPEALQSTSLE